MSNLRTFAAAAALAGLAINGPALAQSPKPAQSQAVSLGGIAGDVYYTVKPDGYHVVATMAGQNQSAPFRFEVVLMPGQTVTVSTPRGVGESADTVEITRQSDHLLVRKGGLVD